MNSYKSLKNRVSAEFTEKKSLFIGNAASVAAEDEAYTFLEKIRKEHKAASHNVYALKLLNGTVKYSDDGEPSRTAGYPVMNIVEHFGITNVILVVTRYFGGILLGAPGLVRAYSTSAKLTLEKCDIVEYAEYICFTVQCAYNDFDKINRYTDRKFITADDISYAENVTLHLAAEASEYEKVRAELIDLSNGDCKVAVKGKRFGVKS